MSGKDLPEVIDKTPEDIAQAINAINGTNLPEPTKKFVIACINLAVWLPTALLEKKISLFNLRKLIFGQGASKRKRGKALNNKKQDGNESADDELGDLASESDDLPTNEDPTQSSNCQLEHDDVSDGPDKKPGHGRHSHDVYKDAIHHHLSIDGLSPGDACPTKCGGKVYAYQPGILVRIKGQQWACAHKYHVEKLRCALCGKLIGAPIPDDVGSKKYDATFKAILAIQKYYIAVPFYRQAYFQSLMNIPLAASTQWQLIEQIATPALSIFRVLETLAANGKIIHADDSHLKILSIIKDNLDNPDKTRTGMFTTAILSKTEQHKIALFYNGTQHAGENMSQLLAKRTPDKNNVIYMCDALSRNTSSSFETILCHCLGHGFRKFDDLKDFYPEECLYVIKRIAKVYDYDDKTRDMTPEARLAYHQEHSKTIMKDIEDYLANLLEEKRVEPNSALGKAIKYMLKHWHELTQFLRVPSAPLDNNSVERLLKIPIRGRRTWLFYKTSYGAMIGGVLTSVIHTCAMAGENPITYLTALQEHQNQVIKEPRWWLPWNYHQQLATLPLAA